MADTGTKTADMEHSDSKARCSRDPRYYYEDGSCILLVEDVLFNVHRSMLSRDGSTFGTLFTVPQGITEEGRSDDNPIVLHGETAAEFRYFLNALYALPPELQSLTSPSANLTGLISIARISNKYAFRSLETWALEAIQDYVNRKPSPILTSIPNPSIYVYSRTPSTSANSGSFHSEESTENLTRLISLAQLCGHTPLLNTMINFLRELMSTSLHYAYLAMTLSDELNLKSLRGAAYLEVMHKAVIVKPLEPNLGLRSPSLASAHRDSSSSNSNHTLILGAMANAVAPLAAIGSGSAFTNASPAAPAAAAGGGPISITGTSSIFTTTTSTSTGTSSSPSTSSSSSSTSSSLSSSPVIPHHHHGGHGHGHSTTTSTTSRISLPITPAQQLRLLSGYYRLSLTWDHLRSTPPDFEHAATCATTWHQHGCTQAWVEFWKDKSKGDAVLSLGAADVLGRLKAIQKEYERWGSAAYMHNDCRGAAKRRMGDLIRKVEEGLSEYYFADAGVELGLQ